MERTRRGFLAAVGTGAAAGLAGCMGQLTAEGATFVSGSASLPPAVQEETGYTHHRTDQFTESREFTRFGISRRVDVTNEVSEYDRAIELGFLGLRLQAAVFSVLTTPQVSILGRSFNPVGEMSPRELAETIQQRYDELEDLEREGTFQASVAGETTTVGRFTARARLHADGERHSGIDVYLYVSEAVPVGDDFVVCVAVHPRLFGRQRDTVERILAAVEHEHA